MITLHRINNLINWLGRNKIWRWRVKRRICLNCSGNYSLFVSNKPANIRCLHCGLTATATALLPVIKEHMQNHGPVNIVWEMSTYGAPAKYCRLHGAKVIETEYIDGHKSGSVINGIRCEDATNSSFGNGEIDLVTSNQVFEHVEDDLQGYRECFRVIRPGGALIFAVPLYNTKESRRIAKMVGAS